MAEIHIQRKRKPVWLWVILALVILVGAMVLFWQYYEDPVNENVAPSTTGLRQSFAPAEVIYSTGPSLSGVA